MISAHYQEGVLSITGTNPAPPMHYVRQQLLTRLLRHLCLLQGLPCCQQAALQRSTASLL